MMLESKEEDKLKTKRNLLTTSLLASFLVLLTLIVFVNVVKGHEGYFQNYLPLILVAEPIPTPTPSPKPTPKPTQNTKVSCGVSPSTIPGGILSTQLYWAQFTPAQAGLGFDISFDSYGSGQRGCIGVANNSGYASCEGSVGIFPFRKTITVTFLTSVGKCITYVYNN